MMKEAKYERKGHVIKNLEDGTVVDCKSNNKAKKTSHELQMVEDGALGRGSVRVAV